MAKQPEPSLKIGDGYSEGRRCDTQFTDEFGGVVDMYSTKAGPYGNGPVAMSQSRPRMRSSLRVWSAIAVLAILATIGFWLYG